VQTGDFLDLGPDDRKVMDLMMKLEKQAPKQESELVVLLGNHEVMNMMGDLRYVSGEAYASFSDTKSEKRRENAYKKYKKFRKQHAKYLSQSPPEFSPEAEEKWMQQHPLGFFKHRDSFGPKGKYGKWLRKHQAIAQIDNAIFLHGGISPELSVWAVDDINARIKSELEAFDVLKKYVVGKGIVLPFFTLREAVKATKSEVATLRPDTTGSQMADSNQVLLSESELRHIQMLEDFLNYSSWLAVNGAGPLWFRGFAQWSDDEGQAHIDSLKNIYGVDHFVVGHSVQADGKIHVRFGGSVFLIDTGMLASHYDGQASALEIIDGQITAIYRDDREVLKGGAGLVSPGAVPPRSDN